MKNIAILLVVLLASGIVSNVYATDENHSMMQMMHHQSSLASDGRIPLGLSPMMKQHQLANMRSHLKAVQSIIGLIAAGSFVQAADIAHSKLGLTKEMKKMCNSFHNQRFRTLGLAFHKSADKLGDILLTRDSKRSLQALQTTMGYCVECHTNFRQ